LPVCSILEEQRAVVVEGALVQNVLKAEEE
jgi:hypothetical protein